MSGGTGGVGMPMALNANESTSSVTKSGISGAAITITDEAKQKQLTGQDSIETIASLNREVSTGQDTSGAISNNLDVNEVQTAMTVTQTFAQQANTFVANQAQKSDKLKAEGEAKQKEADKEPDPARKQQLQAEAQNLYQQSADTKDESKLWQPSGTYGRIATALTAAAGGNITGSTAQLVQGAAVNYLQSLGATEVKKIADSLGSETARAALHGLLACAGGSAQGSDCGSAALGASAGSVINSLMQGDPTTMTAAEKENRKNIVASLVTGIAAATGADNIAAATNAAVIETENNALKSIKIVYTKYDEKTKITNGYADIQEDGKNTTVRIPVTSGHGSPDDSKENVGPTPTGTYTINPSRLQNTSLLDRIMDRNQGLDEPSLGNFLRKIWPSDWGRFRVPLTPDAGTDLPPKNSLPRVT